MDQGEDPYQILGVTNAATTAEVKKAYRRLALLHHPDKNKGDAKAASMFAKVANAYEILSDEERRQQYDLRQRCGGTKGFDSNTSYEPSPTNHRAQTHWTTTTTTNSPQPRYHTKTYYTTNGGSSSSTSPAPMHSNLHSYTRTRTTNNYTNNTNSTSSSSPSLDEEPITVTLNGALPSEMASHFKDPRELFKRMFAKEFGENPDFLSENTPVRVVFQGSSSPPTVAPRSKVVHMPVRPQQPQQQSMASSTRTVCHPDGSMETITETTVTYSDGSVETKRQSSIQPSTASPFSRRRSHGTSSATLRRMTPNNGGKDSTGTSTINTGYRVMQTMS